MAKSLFKSQIRLSSPTNTGHRINIAPGLQDGVLRLRQYTHPSYCTIDDGFIEVSWDFLDSAKRLFRYKNILSIFDLWIPPGFSAAAIDASDFKKEFTVEGLLDSRDEYKIVLSSGGGTFRGRLKYTHFLVNAFSSGECLAICATVNPVPDAPSSQLTFGYYVEIESLLWRKFP
jgi:hypothetical protein